MYSCCVFFPNLVKHAQFINFNVHYFTTCPFRLNFQIFAVFLLSGAIHAAPNPQSQSFDIFKGSSVYPNYYVQHTTPFSNIQNPFGQAAFLPSSNFVDSNYFSNQFNQTNENEKIYDEKTLAAFGSAFGDKDYDKNGDKSAATVKAKVYSTDNAENVNVVNPFLAAKDNNGKLLKSPNGLPGVKAAKPGAVNAKTVTFVNPFHGNGFDPVFGPEIAPRYEIQYSPQGHSFGSINPFPTTNWNDIHFGLQPNFNSGFGPHSSWYPSGSYPSPYPAPFPGQYPSVLPSYPFPNPFIPGYDPKGPKGKDNGGKKEPTTER